MDSWTTVVFRGLMSVESSVTISVARLLGKAGWTIDAMALPGGGSGLVFHPNDEKLGRIIPDIVASRPGKLDVDREILIVEAKPKKSNSDALKLLDLRGPSYQESIDQILGLNKKVFLCLAWADQTPDIASGTLEMDLLLARKSDGQVIVVFDSQKLIS